MCIDFFFISASAALLGSRFRLSVCQSVSLSVKRLTNRRLFSQSIIIIINENINVAFNSNSNLLVDIKIELQGQSTCTTCLDSEY